MPARTNRPDRNREMLTRMELLESRQFLSAASDLLDSVLVHPAAAHLSAQPAATNNATPQGGYTPQQVRRAYGFDGVNFNGVKGDGRGQTIAIVTAYDNPSIGRDLDTFDRQFGLTGAPSFKKVNQTGGSTSAITPDAGWALESALDVEWAHAMAPAADLLLVEAATPSLGNLLGAVDYARRAPGVSVVSMSWGAGEFFGETSLDTYFTTPAGHNGVTFVAASGDDGSRAGASWPAASPNVVSVGGTTLSLADRAGDRGGEVGWRDSGGGASRFEPEPVYQAGAQGTGRRTTPDVAYDADPATGFPVYSSIAFEGVSGWSVVGGTSAGAPQWGALLAIANQGRAANHLGSLDGRTGTLPALYGLHDAGASSYGTNFNDVTAGRSSFFTSARAGYDAVTGLGTPRAAAIAQALAQPASAAVQAVASADAKGSGAANSTHRPRRLHTAAEQAAAAETMALAVAGAALSARPAFASAAPHAAVPTAAITADAPDVSAAGRAALLASSSVVVTQAVHGGLSATLFSDARVTEADARPAAEAALAAARNAISRFAAHAPPDSAHAAPATAQPLGAGPSEGAIETFAGSLPPRRSFHFPRIDALATFNDALAAFADESVAAAVTAALPKGVAGSRRARAWIVSAGVLAADVALFAYWYATREQDEDDRRKQQQQKKEREKPRYWATPGGPFPPGA